jgi:Tetratricopeptide repeat
VLVPLRTADSMIFYLTDLGAEAGRVVRSLGTESGKPERYPEVWGLVPQRNMNFTGRQYLLKQLSAGLDGQEVAAVLPHALHGLGGVGKTQVAIEYAYRNMSSYDVVWWIPADQPALVRSSLAALAPRLGLVLTTAGGIQEAATAVLNALRRGEPYDRWLLIFDNADQPEDISEFIPHGPGHVLITSRNHRWRGVVDTLAIDVFSREESVAFLAKRVRAAIDPPAADRLAQQLGDLPLALEQAGALQAETGMPAGEYLDLLGKQTRELLAESKPTEYPVSMTAAWRISVTRLNEVQPAALALLRCCAFFGPEPIPRDVFRKGIRAADSQLGEILANPILLARVIRDLARFALAQVNTTNRTIQVHRLIQALLREDLDPSERGAFQHEVHQLLAGAAPVDPNDQSKWPNYDELVAHVIPAGVAECQDPAVRRLALGMVRYLYLSGDFDSALAFAREFQEKWAAAFGDNDEDLLTVEWYLGDLLRDMGDYPSAYAVTEAALSHAPLALGPGHETAMALATGFGADLRAHGDFRAAYDNDREALRVSQEALGDEHPRTILARNCLALDYHLVGNYKAAQDLHQRAYIELSKATSMVSKVDVLTSWHGLSRAVRLGGQFTEARILAEDAYEFGIRELGADHLATLRTGKEFSIALRLAGEVAESIPLARDLLARSERQVGDSHPDTLAASTALANSLWTAGEIDEAFAITERITARYATVYDDNHPYLHGCAGNLALLRRLRGDAPGARALNEASLSGLGARLGRDHDYALTVATNLASDLAALGNTHEARLLGETTYQRLIQALGPQSPFTLGCAANLALDLRADDAEAEAEALAGEAIDQLARTLGPAHPYTRAAQAGERLNFDFDPPPI